MVSRTARTRVAGAAVMVVAVLGSMLASPAATAAGTSAPSASPARPISGEVVSFRGSVPPQAARGVRLERRQGGGWAKVAGGRTDGTGSYVLRHRVLQLRGSSTVSYRVVAPRARVAGKVRPQVVSRVRTLRPVGQTAGLRVDPSESAIPTQVTLTATFTPARRGRPVVFQRLAGGSWQVLARVPQDGAGQAAYTQLFGPGTHRVRALTVAAAGAPAAVAPTRTIVIGP